MLQKIRPPDLFFLNGHSLISGGVFYLMNLANNRKKYKARSLKNLMIFLIRFSALVGIQNTITLLMSRRGQVWKSRENRQFDRSRALSIDELV